MALRIRQPEQNVLGFILRLLLAISSRKEVNKMDTKNLATCFAPSLTRAHDSGGMDQMQVWTYERMNE